MKTEGRVRRVKHVHRVARGVLITAAAVMSVGIFSVVVSVNLHKYPQETILLADRIFIPERFIAFTFSQDQFVLMHLGYYHFGGKGEYDLGATETYFRRALILAPKEPMIHFNLARIMFLRGRFNEALRLTREEEKLNPTLDRIYYLRGLIYGYDKKFPQAVEAFLEFNRRQPNTWAGHVDLGWIYFQQGEYAKVKSVLEEIMPTQNNAWLQNAYGLALLNLGEKEKAREAFLWAKVLASRLTPVHWGIAYGGNDPAFYAGGLEEMRRSIDANLALTQ